MTQTQAAEAVTNEPAPPDQKAIKEQLRSLWQSLRTAIKMLADNGLPESLKVAIASVAHDTPAAMVDLFDQLPNDLLTRIDKATASFRKTRTGDIITTVPFRLFPALPLDTLQERLVAPHSSTCATCRCHALDTESTQAATETVSKEFATALPVPVVVAIGQHVLPVGGINPFRRPSTSRQRHRSSNGSGEQVEREPLPPIGTKLSMDYKGKVWIAHVVPVNGEPLATGRGVRNDAAGTPARVYVEADGSFHASLSGAGRWIKCLAYKVDPHSHYRLPKYSTDGTLELQPVA